MIKAQGCEIKVLSTESCAQCETCAYPHGPCRKPERMFPCVESQGILVTDLCEKYGMELDALEQVALKLLHSKTGAAIAKDVFGEAAVLNIEQH